ncbi:MAG: hypothetical protein QMD65_01240 [Patescibacteria group bacterium]|nr:hypothetical protein [Patescibacteria group bacterium]
MNLQESTANQEITLERFLKKELNAQSQSIDEYIQSLPRAIIPFFEFYLGRIHSVQIRIEDFILLVVRPVSNETIKRLIKKHFSKPGVEIEEMFDTVLVVRIDKKQELIVNWTNGEGLGGGKIRISVIKN